MMRTCSRQSTRVPSTLTSQSSVYTETSRRHELIIVILAEKDRPERRSSIEREGAKEREQERQTESKKDREGGKPLRV